MQSLNVVKSVLTCPICCTSYVLLHHVMGETEGRRHSWSYVEGGMGGVSSAIAASAQSHGTEIFTGMVSRVF